MSTREDSEKIDLYSELGVEPSSSAVEIKSRIEEESERANRLKKIPKRRSEAESKLAHLAEAERILLDPSARTAYDSRLQAGEQQPSATQAEKRLATSDSGGTPDPETTHFCTSCGSALPEGARFCEECAAPVASDDATRAENPVTPIEDSEPDHKQSTRDTETKQDETEIPATITVPEQPPQGARTTHGPSPIVFLIPIVLLVVLAAIWFFNRKPTQTIVVPPVPGQVTDLRPSQVSLLNHPILPSSPTASWDLQNIQGTVTIKGEKGTQSIVYPNGAQFGLDAKLFPTDVAGSAVFNEKYGTVLVESPSTFGGQNAPTSWQVQFQVDQAKDINGDGFPEIVLSNYSGGAHCCTKIAVISLRPQGPFVVFDEELGSAGADFKDLDGDGRREIRYEHLFEYALGDFAHGTFGIPVIYSAGKDGVYRVNTRAFAQLMSNEYEAAAEEHQKAAYDSQIEPMEEDRDLIDMFFLAYLGGRSVEGFETLTQLKPLTKETPVTENSSTADPRVILEEALKKVAPEVLQQAEWVRIKSGQLAPEQPTPTEQPGAVPGQSDAKRSPGSNNADALKNPPDGSKTQPAPVPVPATPLQTSGVLHYHGPSIHYGERVTFSNLPGARLKFTFDHQSWQALISRQPDGTQTLTLRSVKQGEQTQCDVGWEMIPDSVSTGQNQQLPVQPLTDQFIGVVHNNSANVSAQFGIIVQDSMGSLAGCMVVKRPLFGSGYLRGYTNDLAVTFTVTSGIGRITFHGNKRGDAIDGTYVVNKSGGSSEAGTFTLKKVKAEGRTSRFDPTNCPTDADSN